MFRRVTLPHPYPLPLPYRESGPELLLQQQVSPPPEGQIRPSKGLIAKFVQSKGLEAAVSEKAVSKIETPAKDRRRFLYLYFQCIEVGRVKWHISGRMFLWRFQIETGWSPAVMKCESDEKPTCEDLFDSSMSALAICHSSTTRFGVASEKSLYWHISGSRLQPRKLNRDPESVRVLRIRAS